jgi:hypothetical protein
MPHAIQRRRQLANVEAVFAPPTFARAGTAAADRRPLARSKRSEQSSLLLGQADTVTSSACRRVETSGRTSMGLQKRSSMMVFSQEALL